MDKIVYKITNRVNGKVYIGQTNNLKRRIQEHKHDKRDDHPIHQAIIEFGFGNFDVEVLYKGSDCNAKEEEYIALYKSSDPAYGYNVLPGRIDSRGELNPSAVMTQEIADAITDDLLNTSLSFKDIANKHNVPSYYVNHINYGESFSKGNIQYPLRDSKRNSIKKLVPNIIEDLRNEEISIDDICRKYRLPKYTVLNINRGNAYVIPTQQYPIRELFLEHSKQEEIIHLLMSTNMTGKEIAKQVGVNLHAVYNINNGKTWHNPEISYPIRKLNPMIATSNDRG